MVDWLLMHQADKLSAAVIQKAAKELSEDPIRLAQILYSGSGDSGIRSDILTAQRAGVGRYIPNLFVNGKWVPRWRLQGEDILGQILAEAGGYQR